jgi:hypothetical protein
VGEAAPRYWLVMRLCRWDSFEPRTFGPYPITVDGGCFGYLPVYETIEEAVEASEDGKYPVVAIAESTRS